MANEVLITELRADINQFRLEMRRATDVVRQTSQQSTQHLASIDRSMNTITTSARTMGHALVAAFSVRALFQFGRAITETALEFDTLRRAMNAAAGDAQLGAQQFAFVREESQRLGLEVTSAATSYKGLLAATVASGKEASVAQVIFRGIAEAVTSMGLSAQDASGTFLAIQQIMSKGKVSAEELRQQLGERFPIAVGVMAQALGKTTGELSKLLDEGKLTSDTLIPFAQKLSERFKKDVVEAAASARAEFNRFNNAVTEALVVIGESGFLGALTEVVKMLTQALNTSIQESVRLFGILRTNTEVLIQALNDLGVAGNASGQSLERGLGVVLRSLANAALIFQRAITLAADGYSILLNFIINGRDAAKRSIEEMERQSKLFFQALADINRVDPSVPLVKLNPELTKASRALPDVSKGLTLFADDSDKLSKAVDKLTGKSLKTLNAEITELNKRFKAARFPGEIEAIIQAVAKLETERLELKLGRPFLRTMEVAKELEETMTAAFEGMTEARRQFAEEDVAALDARRNVDLELKRLTVELAELEASTLDDRLALLGTHEVERRNLLQTRITKDREIAQMTTDIELAELEIRLEALRKDGVDRERLQQLRERTRERIVAQGAARATKIEQDELKRLQQEFEKTAERIADKTADILFTFIDGVLSGAKSVKDIFTDMLGTVRQLFTRALAEMAAEAIARPIVIPIVQGLFGGGRGVSGSSFLNLPIPFFGGSGLQGPGLNGQPLGGGLTLGNLLGVIGPAATVVGAGALGSQLFGGGRTGNILGGAIAGGLAGGPLGIGVGALGGFIASLFGGSKERQVFTERFDLPRFLATETGLGITGSTDIGRLFSKGGVGQDTLDLLAQITQISDATFQGIAGRLQGIPAGMAEAIADSLNTIAEDIDTQLTEIRLSKDGTGIKAVVQQFLQEFPQRLEAEFRPVLEMLERIGPIAQGLGQAIDTLRQQQAQLMATVRSARRNIEEALFTPGMLFERRRGELQGLLQEFDTGGDARRAQLVPQLASLAQEVFSLAQQDLALGQDPMELRRLQRELLGILDELGADTQALFSGRITEAEEQIRILTDFRNVTDTQLSQANTSLQQIVTFLARMSAPFVGTFQEGGFVPRTGMAMVHQGETVLPAGQSPVTLQMTVNVQGGSAMTGQQIGEQAWRYIESQARRRAIPLKLGR